LRDIIINKQRVSPGEEVQIDIRIARLPSHTWIDLPVFVFRSKVDGPSLLLTAGIHGDEINGIEIVRKLITRKMISPDRGTVIAIPLVNVYGFINNSRNLPDGKDLNRCFPGGNAGSLAKQIAHIIMEEILPNIDYGVDFHTGGSRISNYPQIRALISNEKNLELAKAFGAPYIINSNLIDKSFRKAAAQIGKSILVYEGGESLRIDHLAIQEGMNGVIRLMNHLKIKKSYLRKYKSTILRERSWTRAKMSGIFNAKVEYGDEVKKNQMIAVLTDPYGNLRVPVKSPIHGYVIGINNMPVVNAGDALFHIGKEIPG
jgi:uncharacterized protein